MELVSSGYVLFDVVQGYNPVITPDVVQEEMLVSVSTDPSVHISSSFLLLLFLLLLVFLFFRASIIREAQVTSPDLMQWKSSN